ncbi:MAG TPA: trypsin-like peptidase domain-containing protein, partial [Bryobacteraceae bacterium]
MVADRGLYVLLFTLCAFPAFPFQRSMSVADIARAVRPSVVVITTQDQGGNPLEQGSGFIVASDGLIATNVHVVDGAYSATVELENGDVYDSVWVVAFDRRRDLALIRIKALNLHPVRLGDSDNLKVGEHITAIGNPSGLTDTVSDGILSAQRQVDGITLLQVTAPISPGSSGGP